MSLMLIHGWVNSLRDNVIHGPQPSGFQPLSSMQMHLPVTLRLLLCVHISSTKGSGQDKVQWSGQGIMVRRRDQLWMRLKSMDNIHPPMREREKDCFSTRVTRGIRRSSMRASCVSQWDVHHVVVFVTAPWLWKSKFGFWGRKLLDFFSRSRGNTSLIGKTGIGKTCNYQSLSHRKMLETNSRSKHTDI